MYYFMGIHHYIQLVENTQNFSSDVVPKKKFWTGEDPNHVPFNFYKIF